MLRSIIIIFFVAILSGQAFSQENEWPISPKHKRKLEKVKDAAQRDKLLAKFLRKDSIKYQKKVANRIKKNWKKTLSDSLNHRIGKSDIIGDSLKLQQTKQNALRDLKDKHNIPDVPTDSTIVDEAKSGIKRALKDSLDNYIDVPDLAIDSSKVDQVKSRIKSEGKEKLENELGLSIPDVAIDSTTTNQVTSELKSKGKQALQNELGTDIPAIKIDSTTQDQVKSELKSRGKKALQEELGTDIPDITVDSTTMDQLAKEAEKRAIEAMKQKGDIGALEDIPTDSELGQLSKYKDQIEQTQQQLKQGLAKQKIKEKMAASARKFIQENASQISEVQSKMGELKKKYSYVPNSNDLSTAKKRSSLKGESLWKRLVIGGNFSVSKTNPLRIDLSPVIGYKINKLFEVGVTGAYRTQFKADKSGVTQNGEEVYGFSLFADHMVFKNFFGHLEGESLRTNTGTPENQMREWKQTLLVGIGRKFNVAKWLEMQALVLYNPLHDNTDGIYNSPVVFKTGIRVRK